MGTLIPLHRFISIYLILQGLIFTWCPVSWRRSSPTTMCASCTSPSRKASGDTTSGATRPDRRAPAPRYGSGSVPTLPSKCDSDHLIYRHTLTAMQCCINVLNSNYIYLFIYFSPPHGIMFFPFTGGLLLLLKATGAAREPTPRPFTTVGEPIPRTGRHRELNAGPRDTNTLPTELTLSHLLSLPKCVVTVKITHFQMFLLMKILLFLLIKSRTWKCRAPSTNAAACSISVDEAWSSLVNALSGLFCASLNFMDRTVTASPEFAYRPAGENGPRRPTACIAGGSSRSL